MKYLSINMVGDVCINYIQPKTPKGSQSFLKHFYDEYKKYIPKNKLLTNNK
jgi:hypothetical protein